MHMIEFFNDVELINFYALSSGQKALWWPSKMDSDKALLSFAEENFRCQLKHFWLVREIPLKVITIYRQKKKEKAGNNC